MRKLTKVMAVLIGSSMLMSASALATTDESKKAGMNNGKMDCPIPNGNKAKNLPAQPSGDGHAAPVRKADSAEKPNG